MIKVCSDTIETDDKKFDFEHKIQIMIRENNIMEDDIINIETSVMHTPKRWYDYFISIQIIYKLNKEIKNERKF